MSPPYILPAKPPINVVVVLDTSTITLPFASIMSPWKVAGAKPSLASKTMELVGSAKSYTTLLESVD